MNKQQDHRIDWMTLCLALACAGYGLALIYAATFARSGVEYVTVQAISLGIGVVGFVCLQKVDVDRWQGIWWVFLLGNLLLQASLLLFGVSAGNNRSWLRFWGIGIQPAELGKVLFVLSLAGHLHAVRDRCNRLPVLLGLLAHVGGVVGVVLYTANDLGMALVYALLGVVLLFVGGLAWRWFALLGVVGVASLPWLFDHLQAYQKQRIQVLFDPALSPDTYYQTLQSKIALGGGGLYGQGWLSGIQTQSYLLPEAHTDFIFSVAGEAFGFVGCALLVGMLLWLVLRTLRPALEAQTLFARLLAVGVGGMIALQAVENIMMCLGYFPVMGLTLPLFSYGGSSMVTTWMGLGLVHTRRM